MTKTELVDAMATHLSKPKAEVARAVESFIDTVQASLVKGNEVKISKLGIFQIRKRAAKKVKVPGKNQVVDVKAHSVVGFKAAKSLKEAVKHS